MLRRSWDKPELFWAEVADQLFWYRRWDKVLDGGFPNFRYFIGGLSNVCYNLLDRHLVNNGDNRLALIWEGENGERKFYTYRMLHAEVNRFADALRNIAIKKEDPVAIYLPNLPETLISVLACYRIGAIFNTVFSGFSTKALRERIINYEPKLIITADAGYRRGVTLSQGKSGRGHKGHREHQVGNRSSACWNVSGYERRARLVLERSDEDLFRRIYA